MEKLLAFLTVALVLLPVSSFQISGINKSVSFLYRAIARFGWTKV